MNPQEPNTTPNPIPPESQEGAVSHVQSFEEPVRIEQRSETDCLRCCLAMVSGLRYEDVPDFVASHNEEWPSACERWMQSRGLGLLMLGNQPKYVPPWLPIIAKGPTARAKHHHCVVVTHNSVIDPHASQDGLIEIVDRYAVVQIPSSDLASMRSEVERWQLCMKNAGEDYLKQIYSLKSQLQSLEMANAQMREAIQINHKWHQDYDEYDGYAGSEMFDINHKALSIAPSEQGKRLLGELERYKKALETLSQLGGGRSDGNAIARHALSTVTAEPDKEAL